MHHKLSFRRKLQAFFLSLLLVLLTAAGVPSAAYTAEAASADTTMAVHFLDVGQGLSILVQSRGENLLYDGGDRGHSSFVVSYLQKQNISTIDYMISSHYDEDHVAGLVGCLDSFSVKNVIGADYVQDTKIYQSFENSVASQGLTVQHPEPGTDFAFGSGKFTVLSPQSISSNDNDNSVAIRLENGSNHFLFTGDAESAGEEAICNLGLDLSCDVIVPGHHGSATATTWDLLQETVPEYAVISCGAGNSYGHPHKDTMDKLADMGIHYDGWKLADAAAFFHTYGITDDATIEDIYDLIIADPANYLKYYIGYLEFLELKKNAVDKWGDNFTQMRFHKAVLDVGPASFDVIRAYLF